MKNIFLLTFLFIFGNNLYYTNNQEVKEILYYNNCGKYKNRQLYKGPKGGCYYINSNGNKTYVDRSFCKC